MKTKIKNNNFKNIIDIFIWPLFFIVGQFLINFIFSFAYNIFNKNIPTEELVLKCNNFLNEYKVLISFIGFIIFMFIFTKKYKKLFNDKYSVNKEFVYIALFGIGYSIIINILFLNINDIFNISDSQFLPIPNKEIIPSILCSGIMGPILEELLFRGIVYNKIKEISNEKKGILLTSLFFGLVHMNLFNCINAFILSFILIHLYNKSKTIIAPIILHISVNTIVVLIINIISINLNNLNYILFFIGMVLILFSSKKVFNNH